MLNGAGTRPPIEGDQAVRIQAIAGNPWAEQPIGRTRGPRRIPGLAVTAQMHDMLRLSVAKPTRDANRRAAPGSAPNQCDHASLDHNNRHDEQQWAHRSRVPQ